MSKIKTIHDLEFDNKNFNKGNEHGKELIKKSLKDHGAGRSILVDKNAKIIAGNKTTENFKELGFEKIKIIKAKPDELVVVQRDDIDLDTPKGRAMALADNKTSEANLEWDFEMMQEQLPAELLEEWQMQLPEEELEATEDDYTEPDDMQVDVVLGDLIEIGEHRLLCGDSTDSDQVAKLMNGDQCNLLTDPPYGINANKQTLGSGKKQFYRGDSWDSEVPDFYYILALVDKAIIWGGNYFTENLEVSNDWLCWHKKNDNLSFSEFELAWSNLGNNCRHLSHHWGKESKLHPTMKPVKVIEWCINMLDDKPILDIFLGSGSTMVAAHQLKRKCFGMELDPKYCQVIVDRMMKLDESLVIKINGKEYNNTLKHKK